MQKIEARIRQAVSEGRWAFTVHAEERLAERGIEPWQVLAGFEDGETIRADEKSKPNPKILLRQILSDGTPIVTVWAFLKSLDSATLVTVYFEAKT
jgi:hypothetical protein